VPDRPLSPGRVRRGNSEKQPADIGEIMGDVVGLAELGGGLAGGEADHREAGGFGSGDAGWTVFDSTAITGRKAKPAGGGKVNFGVGFEVLDGVAADGDFEVLGEAGHFEDDVDDFLPGTGGDGERVASGQRRDEFGKVPVNRAVVANKPVEMLEFPGMQFGGRFGPGMFGEEVAEENAVGNAEVIPVNHAVGAREAEIGKQRFPSLGVEWFAVNQHAVEVEDHGLEAWRFGRLAGGNAVVRLLLLALLPIFHFPSPLILSHG